MLKAIARFVLACLTVACVSTGTGEPRADLRKIGAYVLAAEQTLDGFVAATALGDPLAAQSVRDLAQVVEELRQRIDLAVAGGAETLDMGQAIDFAISVTYAVSDSLIEDPELRARISGVAVAIGGLLRLARIELMD
jgi:hypothetical protein